MQIIVLTRNLPTEDVVEGVQYDSMMRNPAILVKIQPFPSQGRLCVLPPRRVPYRRPASEKWRTVNIYTEKFRKQVFWVPVQSARLLKFGFFFVIPPEHYIYDRQIITYGTINYK
jgi:hypothetical protein